MRNAREAAFADAKARADQYARLAGDKLGKAFVITETNTVDAPQASYLPRSAGLRRQRRPYRLSPASRH